MQEKEPFLIDVKYQQFLTIITLYHYNKHCFQTLVQLSINLRNFSFSFFLSFNACWTLTFNMKILSLALSYIWIFQSCRGALSYVFIIALSDVFPLFNLCYSISLKMNGGRYYNDFLDEFSFNLKVKACCFLFLICLNQQIVKALYHQLLICLLLLILRLKDYLQNVQEGIRLSKLKIGSLYSRWIHFQCNEFTDIN